MITENGKQKEKYYTTSQPLHCFSRPATMRSRYCTSEHALQLLVDQCIISIIAQNITEQSCHIEETKQTDSLQYITEHDDVIDIDNDSELTQPQNLIVTNNDLVSLMTICKNNNSETITPLPLASRIHVPAICSLKLLNAPDVLMIQPDTDVTFVNHQNNPNYIKTLHDLIRGGSEGGLRRTRRMASESGAGRGGKGPMLPSGTGRKNCLALARPPAAMLRARRIPLSRLLSVFVAP
jgi:hypothetical protein